MDISGRTVLIVGGTAGIGLALARQIAESHGGTVTLANRDDGARGCRAVVTLPARASPHAELRPHDDGAGA